MAASTPITIGRYRVIRPLGEGGMGWVYLARDPEIDRLVAIKVMRGGSDDDLLRERFKREARAVGRLQHPNVVTIFDVGEHGNEPFIAMEYVEGATLMSLIRNGEPVGLFRRLAVMDGLCAGLHYAHRAGIIHRDIKPANVMITGEGDVKIVDFGIARGESSGITQSGAAVGTLNYMSPEQLAGQPIDHRSDIFAVGAVFYELLSGRRAFPGDVQSGVLNRIISGAPEPLDRVCPGLSPEVIAVVDRCLEKDPRRRYPDLDAMRRALAAYKADANDTTVPLGPRLPDGPRRSRTPRPPSDGMRAELLRQRQERITAHLEQAGAALAANDFPAALAACHQALILDPEHAETLDLQELIERTQQAHDWLKNARSELDRGALTAASDLVDRVLAMVPSMPEALEARRAISEARRDLEERRARARALDDAVSRAEKHLDAGELALAAAALDAALTLEAGHPPALALRSTLAQRGQARKRAERDELARNAIADARRLFAAGSYQAAVERLAAFSPPHPDIDEARLALEFEFTEIRRREEERRRAEERERAETERLTRTPAVRDATDPDRPLLPDAQPASLSRRATLIAGVAAALVLVVVWWAVSGPAPVAPVPPVTATVLFDFQPWAQIEAIVLKSGGQTIEPACPATPCRVSLGAGEYHVRARNPYLAAALEFDLTVVAGEHQDIRRSFPQFKAADEARRILEGR